MVSIIFLYCIAFAHFSTLFGAVCPICGGMNVPYPLSTYDNCGNLRYKVYCNNGNSLEFLSAEGFYYKILSIDPNASKLIIKPPTIEKNTCQSSDLSLGGFRIDDNSPFNVSSRNAVMLFNCSENILFSPLNCSSNSLCRQFKDKVEEGLGSGSTLCCFYLKDASMNSHRIRVRVGGCSAYTSVVDLKAGARVDSWNYGIELQWSSRPY